MKTFKPREDTSSFSEEKEAGASPEKIIFQVKEASAEAHEIWTDFKALLIVQGNEDKAARGMIGRLISNYHAERVARCYEANRDLIYGQVDAYGYFIEILKRDKKLNKDEGVIQTALREACYYHAQMYAGLDYTPTFNPVNYVKQYPALQKYIDDIASGAREIPEQDKKTAEKERLFNESVLEQHRFYSQFEKVPRAESTTETGKKLLSYVKEKTKINE